MISLKHKKQDTEHVNDAMLHIECRGCSEPCLGDSGCVRCICEHIVRFGEPERISLRSGVTVEYSHETVELLRRLSDSFSRTSCGRSGRKCAGCVLSRESLEEEKWAELSVDNIDEIIGTLDKVYLECNMCQTCITEAKDYFEMLRMKLVALSEEAAKLAYRIVGA
ncbi:MAG: hypothetical protein J5673_05535 [Candidatus Methanomethylophilaceae archaeon]|nr:hypothetical protein [Candidatus Methanomethylophilaceae archaeon]